MYVVRLWRWQALLSSEGKWWFWGSSIVLLMISPPLLVIPLAGLLVVLALDLFRLCLLGLVGLLRAPAEAAKREREASDRRRAEQERRRAAADRERRDADAAVSQ